MGSCLSSRRSFPAVELKKLSVPGSPIKENPTAVVDRPIADSVFQSPPTKSYGSIQETFFDSAPRLDSDCEDDFLNVKGDFTPSLGSTPVHHDFCKDTPIVTINLLEKTPDPITKVSPSPIERKKKLSEFFQNSNQDDQESENNSDSSTSITVSPEELGPNKPTVGDIFPSLGPGTPFVSGANSVCGSKKIPNGGLDPDREKSSKSHSCFPSLVDCRSFSGRRKKKF